MGAISVYAFNTNPGIQTHVHPHGHLIIVLEKEFYFRFRDNECHLKPGQIGFIPPGVEHDYSCSGKAVTLNIPEEMVKATDLLFLTEHFVRDIDEKLQPLLDLIIQEVDSSSPQNESLRYLFYYLYDKLVNDDRMLSVRYINDNYAEDIRVEQLAEMENYNPSYYASVFRKKMGCIPSDYIRMVRIEKAKEILLTTHYPVINVAMQVGYANASSFTRVFRETTGMTPHQFRRMQGTQDSGKSLDYTQGTREETR